MRAFWIRDRQTAGLQALMNFRDRAMLPEPPGTNEGNHIQAKFAMGQRPPSFLFGMIAHMIPWAGGGVALTEDHPELPESLQGHHLPSAMICYPQSVTTRFTGLPKRYQSGGELRFGSRGSSCHGAGSCCKKASCSASAYTCCQGKFTIQPKKPSGQRYRLSSSGPARFERSKQGLALVTKTKADELLALSAATLPS